MIFHETSLKGAFIIEPERMEDARGFFARTWCEREFAAHSVQTSWVQNNLSFNLREGTLRGMHYQAAPHEEEKLVRCTMGAIFDVMIDLRLSSPTYLRHVAVEVSAQNRKMVYIPKGVAHGFQTLEDDVEVFYQISEFYVPQSARGVRWNDLAFNIVWPEADRIISDRDQSYPNFIPLEHSNTVEQAPSR